MELNIVTKEDLEIAIQKLVGTIEVLLKQHKESKTLNALYSNYEACKYLKVCGRTLQSYRDNGLIRFIQTGRKIYYYQKDLNAFLESYRKKTFLELINGKQHGHK